VASLKHDPVLAKPMRRRTPVSGATVSAVCSLIFRPFRNDWPRKEAEHRSPGNNLCSNGGKAEAVRLLREEFDNHLDEFPYARQDLTC